jgi:hypothetical protein
MTQPQPRVARAARVARATALLLLVAGPAAAADAPAIGPVPVDFLLFGLTLLGVALLPSPHAARRLDRPRGDRRLEDRLLTLSRRARRRRLRRSRRHEWVLLANLLGLLVGFALLSKHFEASAVPAWLPRLLPNDWKGAFVLLVMIFVLSSFLDNHRSGAHRRHDRGGGVPRQGAHRLSRGDRRGSNAGGSGSVVGDTTTTMMWIAGVSPLSVLEATSLRSSRSSCSAFRRRCSSSAIRPSSAIPRASCASTGCACSSSRSFSSRR